MKAVSVEEFYKEIAAYFPEEISREIGHFNIFRYEDLIAQFKVKPVMPYSRRTYYKISLITGRYKLEYADKVMEIANNTLLFSTPNVPYHYIPKDENQSGYFCIFTDEFLVRNKSGVALDDLPIFKPGGYPVFQISEE